MGPGQNTLPLDSIDWAAHPEDNHENSYRQFPTIGNGRNDALMLKQAALGIAVVQTEGAATAALMAPELVTPGIIDALDLLLYPDRLKATLRF